MEGKGSDVGWGEGGCGGEGEGRCVGGGAWRGRGGMWGGEGRGVRREVRQTCTPATKPPIDN